jgi:hypothetical protein
MMITVPRSRSIDSIRLVLMAVAGKAIADVDIQNRVLDIGETLK